MEIMAQTAHYGLYRGSDDYGRKHDHHYIEHVIDSDDEESYQKKADYSSCAYRNPIAS